MQWTSTYFFKCLPSRFVDYLSDFYLGWTIITRWAARNGQRRDKNPNSHTIGRIFRTQILHAQYSAGDYLEYLICMSWQHLFKFELPFFQDLLNFVAANNFLIEEFKLISSWPRKDLTAIDATQTLESLKLYPRETVMLQERWFM